MDMVKEIEAEVENRIAELQQRIDAGRQAIIVLRRLFDGVGPGSGLAHHPVNPHPLVVIEPARSKKNKKVSRRKPAAERKERKTSIGYKGVKKCKPYVDGREKFSAQFYNPETKKLEYLGSFDNVYMAAAAYQERVGNQVKADELREQAGQARLNPTGKKKKTIWVCKRCGMEYRTKPTSLGCLNCRTNDFREVPAE